MLRDCFDPAAPSFMLSGLIMLPKCLYLMIGLKLRSRLSIFNPILSGRGRHGIHQNRGQSLVQHMGQYPDQIQIQYLCLRIRRSENTIPAEGKQSSLTFLYRLIHRGHCKAKANQLLLIINQQLHIFRIYQQYKLVIVFYNLLLRQLYGSVEARISDI